MYPSELHQQVCEMLVASFNFISISDSTVGMGMGFLKGFILTHISSMSEETLRTSLTSVVNSLSGMLKDGISESRTTE